jgi:type I restriction enzyme M protein
LTLTTPAPNVTHDIVQKLWNLCNVLKDDGVTYHQYVTELTYLLFVKMAEETGTEGQLPEEYRWKVLESKSAAERLTYYRKMLVDLGGHKSALVREIFANASSFIKKPATLSTLVTEIDKLDWYSARHEGLGDLYEGPAGEERQREEIRRRAVFHPAPADRQHGGGDETDPGDVIQDPAAGTGGFLIAANRHIRADRQPGSWTEAEQRKYSRNTFYGMEFVQDTHRLALMNLMLHGWITTPNRAASGTATPSARTARACQSHADPDQPALRHQKRRRVAQPDGFHLRHQQQAVRLFTAHLSRTQARRARRGGAAR